MWEYYSFLPVIIFWILNIVTGTSIPVSNICARLIQFLFLYIRYVEISIITEILQFCGPTSNIIHYILFGLFGIIIENIFEPREWYGSFVMALLLDYDWLQARRNCCISRYVRL